MTARTNLNDLARDITIMEGLEQNQSVAQVKETLGLLGIRWRSMPLDEAIQEFECILERAGALSSHKENM